MFTWICPKCGREVPPSYDECPNCAAATAQPAQPAAPAPPAPPSTQYAPPQTPAPPAGWAQPSAPAPPPPAYPPQAYAPQQQPAYAPPPPPPGYPQQAAYPYPMAPRRKMPEWLVMVLVAIGSVGVFALAYFYLLPSSRKAASNSAPTERSAAEKSAAGAKEHPYAKFLDVTGIRVIEDSKQNVQVKFLVVNHSPAEMGGVKAEVILKPVNSKPDTPPVTEFSFKLPTLGGYESREVTVPAKTKLRAYEMPDWQFLQSEVHISAE